MPPPSDISPHVDDLYSLQGRLTRTETKIDYLERLTSDTNQHLCRIDEKLNTIQPLVLQISMITERLKNQEDNLKTQEKETIKFTTKGRIIQGLAISVFLSVFLLAIKTFLV